MASTLQCFIILISLLLNVSSTSKLSDSLNKMFNRPVVPKKADDEKMKDDPREAFQSAIYQSYNRILQLAIITIAGALVGLARAQVYVHSKHGREYLGDVPLGSLPRNVSIPELPVTASSLPVFLYMLPFIIIIAFLIAILLTKNMST